MASCVITCIVTLHVPQYNLTLHHVTRSVKIISFGVFILLKSGNTYPNSNSSVKTIKFSLTSAVTFLKAASHLIPVDGLKRLMSYPVNDGGIYIYIYIYT